MAHGKKLPCAIEVNTKEPDFTNIYKIIGEELAFETFYSNSQGYYKCVKKLSSSWGANFFWSHDHATALYCNAGNFDFVVRGTTYQLKFT